MAVNDGVKRLAKVFGAVRAHVISVQIDFNTHTLEGVDGTLVFVVKHSGPSRAIMFDYMYTSLLDGTVQHGDERDLVLSAADHGE